MHTIKRKTKWKNVQNQNAFLLTKWKKKSDNQQKIKTSKYISF